jgi:prolyl-tRNA editing enzyme YbaK/EbsC (Cys-tRNA(Pro) deacylase)
MLPLGNLCDMPVIVDASLLADDVIVFNACTHSKMIRMHYGGHEMLVRPRVAAFAKPSFVANDVEVE